MFTYHNETTAPEASQPFIAGAKAMFGFLPNLHAVLAESPAAHEAYTTLYRLATEQTALSPVEVQVVMMTSNYINRCHYCMAGHSMIMGMLKAPQDVIDALRNNTPIPDSKLEALRVFARGLLEKRGHVGDEALQDFLDAGYTKQQALDVLVCLSAKLLSNFTNALSHTEVDAPMKPMAWPPPA
ncbi:carboxymuconolactone decarboxylase family protein [Erythrobacter sp.]|uniref:carboxymuconolactone decarboxylase family protein n=1 Tax=Erythrobacter sp. TaxID=1042 RepID=UPI00311F6CDE